MNSGGMEDLLCVMNSAGQEERDGVGKDTG